MPAPPVRYVFVYGTLRCGGQRDINRLLPAPRRVGRATVAGVMHDLGAYPGVVLGGTGLVRGEVYQISAELERQLDEIEEVWPEPSGEYAKREVAVQLERPSGGASAQLVCVLYEIAPARAWGKPVITGGDWAQYRADSAV
jgi:gamma-glutamylcyclotransferase (GGCT)/AIG2-like uncharacterized protein YtfP